MNVITIDVVFHGFSYFKSFSCKVDFRFIIKIYFVKAKCAVGSNSAE